MLQPLARQQQQMVMRHGSGDDLSSRSGVRDNSRMRVLNTKRMGMVILSPTSDSSSSSTTRAEGRKKQNRVRRRPRDMSCDPSLIRGISRHDARIYDRVPRDDHYCGTLANDSRIERQESWHIPNEPKRFEVDKIRSPGRNDMDGCKFGCHGISSVKTVQYPLTYDQNSASVQRLA